MAACRELPSAGLHAVTPWVVAPARGEGVRKHPWPPICAMAGTRSSLVWLLRLWPFIHAACQCMSQPCPRRIMPFLRLLMHFGEASNTSRAVRVSPGCSLPSTEYMHAAYTCRSLQRTHSIGHVSGALPAYSGVLYNIRQSLNALCCLYHATLDIAFGSEAACDFARWPMTPVRAMPIFCDSLSSRRHRSHVSHSGIYDLKLQQTVSVD